MNSPAGLLQSSVGKKILSGLTGLALLGFVIVHLIGNLAIFAGPEALNVYAHTLHSIGGGVVVYVAEALLASVFLIHIVSGIQVALSRSRARPASNRYAVSANAGASSRKTSASVSMIYTGILLLVFTIFHLISFKFGPSQTEGYVIVHNGVEMRDLYRLVVEKFQSGIYTGAYVVIMALLGWHLRHGIWSSFQSLGLMNPKFMPVISAAGALLAAALAAGFIILPLYVFLFVSPV